MLTKTLIISTNLHKDITCFADSQAVNFVLECMVKEHLQEICDAYNLDDTLVTVHYRAIASQVDFLEGYASALDDDVLRPITQAAKNHLEHSILAARAAQAGVSVETTMKLQVNFNVMFLANGTIIITEEVFES